MQLLKNILLLALAITLGLIFIPIGVIFAIVKLSLTMKFKEMYNHLCDLFFTMSKGIDRLGNIACMYLFNATLIKVDDLSFGYEKETVSSVLGRNLEANNLTTTGKVLNNILNIFQNNHSIKSIGS